MKRRFLASVLSSIIAVALGTIPTAHSSYECKCDCHWVCSTMCDSNCTGCSMTEIGSAIDRCCESKRSSDTLPCLEENSY